MGRMKILALENGAEQYQSYVVQSSQLTLGDFPEFRTQFRNWLQKSFFEGENFKRFLHFLTLYSEAITMIGPIICTVLLES